MFKRLLTQFTRTAYVIDLRPSEMTRKARCERYAKKNKTCGKPARFAIGGAA